MKKLYTLLTCSFFSFFLSAQTVWINEIHYDNIGADVNEGVEIAGLAGTDLTGWKLLPYNGDKGTYYSSKNLEGTIPDQMNGYGTVWIPVAGLQNGSPDGIALVNASSTVIQFLSYEGSFEATNGEASGMTSIDIGVAQSSSTPAGSSLQLQGTGTAYTDFTWTANIEATRGAPNNDQIFGKDPLYPVWTTGYPRAGKVFDNKVEILLSMDKPGTAYYIVMAEGTTTPSGEEVKAGINYGTETVLLSGTIVIDKGDTEYKAIITSSDPETTYNIYVVAEDNMAIPNLQTTPVMISVTTTTVRTLVITSPVATGTYYAGGEVTFSWSSANITNVIIGGYDYDNSEEFLITDDDDAPYVIDATLGQFIYTLPNGLSTNLVDIRIYDADDIAFFKTVTPVNLLDEINPSLKGVYPPNGGVYIPVDVELFAFFDEDVYPGTGNVVLKKIKGNSVVETFDIAAASEGGAIEVKDEILTLRPSADLEEGTIYYIEMDAGVVTDYDDNQFAGITGSGIWSFKSFTEPALLFMDDFNDGDLAPWTTLNVSGDTKEWEAYQETARMNGFNSGDIEDDWLISPPIDGTGYEDLIVLFDLWFNLGIMDNNNYLKFYYSTDYDGNSANLATATWTELDFEIPATSSITMPSGILTIDPSSYPLYFAFEYKYEPANYREWKIDNFFVGGVLLFSSDATLSDLLVDGTSVDNFDAATLAYTVTLVSGTATVPTVTATATEENAQVTITQAVNVTGTETERTSTIVVVSHNQASTTTYTIVFEVSTSVDKSQASRIRIYPVPVQQELTIENISAFKSIEIMDMAGSRVLLAKTEGRPDYRINVSFLPEGIYFLRLRTENGVITRKFVKE